MDPLAPRSPPPLWHALLAAFTPLLGLPVLLVGLILLSGGRVADAFIEGGWPMWAILVGGGISAIGAGVLLGLATRSRTWAAGALLPLTALASVVGVFGTSRDVREAVEAVAHASPHDRGLIMCAAVGESTWAMILGLLVTAALLGGSFVGLLIAAWSNRGEPQRHHRRLLGTLATLALTAALTIAVELQALAAFQQFFKAAAHAAPMDRSIIMFAALDDLARWGLLAAIGLAACLVVLSVGLVAVRDARLSMLALGGQAILLAALAPAIVQTMDGAAAWAVSAVAFSETKLARFDGRAVDEAPRFQVDAQGVHPSPSSRLDRAELADVIRGLAEKAPQPLDLIAAEGHARGGAVRALRVTLSKDAAPAAFAELLELSAQHSLETVALYGERPATRPAETPVPVAFEGLVNAVAVEPVGVIVKVRQAAVACVPTCEYASLTKGSVTIGGTTWAPASVERYSAFPPADREVFVQGGPGLDPVGLATSAVTAASHGATLVVVVAPPP